LLAATRDFLLAGYKFVFPISNINASTNLKSITKRRVS